MTRQPILVSLALCLCFCSFLSAGQNDESQPKENDGSVIRLYARPSDDHGHRRLPLNSASPSQGTAPARHHTLSSTTILFTDDFEGKHPNWWATGTWGSTFQDTNDDGLGHAVEDHSDWDLATDNFSSSGRSWHESGATLIQTDMLLSPVFALPTEVMMGQQTSPLTAVNLSFSLDWDAADPGDQLRVYAGRTETLWQMESSDPGAGRRSWRCAVPERPPYTEFIRQFLTTPEIDLTGATSPVTLSFLYQSITEPDFDYNNVEVSTDNFVSYRTVASFQGSFDSGGQTKWARHRVDLSAFIGAKVRIRFSHNGDFTFVEPGTVFALDEIKVADRRAVLFHDDGGESGASEMVATGFVPGNQLAIFSGKANPLPFWIHVDLAEYGINLLDGTDHLTAPGDSMRVGFVFVSSGIAPGRGIYLDDVTVSGQGKLRHDLSAISVDSPFPATVGKPATFALKVANVGLDAQTRFDWTGMVEDATGNIVATVAGSYSGNLAPDSVASVTATSTWIPEQAGVYSFRGVVHLSTDNDHANDTTRAVTSGAGFYNRFFVTQENLIFAANLEQAGGESPASTLEDLGFRVQSHSAPGVATWHLGRDPRTHLPGAVVTADSLQRSQDEELIIPNLDFTWVTSDAKLNFYGQAVAGFTYTCLSVGVSLDGGRSWSDIFNLRRGTDPQTGIFYGHAAFLRKRMGPADLDLTSFVAGHARVWIRFRYQAQFDESWVVWRIAISGKGLRPAELHSVTDVPNDQGKQVRLTWSASPNDGKLDGMPVTAYGIWRQLSSSSSSDNEGSTTVRVENRLAMITNIAGMKSGAQFYDISSGETWEFVDSVLAHSDREYNFVAPTLEDGRETCFMISAHTANPLVFANSNTACGVSTDDLPPHAPANLTAGMDGRFARLTWEPPDNEEPQFYSIYRSQSSGHYPDKPMAITTEATFRDFTGESEGSLFYVVTATDFSSNESGFSNEVKVLATSVASRTTTELPDHYGLSQNHPNPFNPSTRIRYQLPQNASVTLRVFNGLGQQIRVLVAGPKTAGYHEIAWDGRDEHGEPVGSGVYVCRLEAGDFIEVRKMLLIR